MIFKTEIKLNENSDLMNFSSNLRGRSYIVSPIEHGHLSIEQGKLGGFFQNGFSVFLIDKTIIESTQTSLRVTYELNTLVLLLFITCVLGAILIQVFDVGLSKDLIMLLTVSPVLMIVGLGINLMAAISTIEKDIKSSLKKTKGL